MKRLILHFSLLFIAHVSFTQGVGIGTITPDPSAVMEVSSVTQGMLVPRMTTAQRNAIESPATGLIIFNLDDQCIDIFEGMNWIKNCGMKVTGQDTVSPQWVQRANFGGGGRSGAVAFELDSIAYMGTGADPAFKNDFWAYDPGTNSWTQKADFGGSARTGAVGFAIGGGILKGYIGTGYDGSCLSDFWEYDPAMNGWTQKASLPNPPRTEAVGFTVALQGYIGTGMDNSNEPLADMYGYNPIDDTWLGFPGVNNGNGEAFYQLRNAAAFSIGSLAYIGTGYIYDWTESIPEGETNLFWSFDPNEAINGGNGWTVIAPFAGGTRMDMSACGLMVGTGSQNGTDKNDMWQYNPTNNTWTQLVNFGGTARTEAVGFQVAGKSFICGGFDGGFKNDLWEYLPYPQGPVYTTSQSLTDLYYINDGIWTKEGSNVYSSNTGNVGIGTINPSTKLEVAGSFKVTGPVVAPIKFENTIANRKVVLWESFNNDHQYLGLGINTNALRFQVSSTNDAHIFYAGTAPTTSTEIMRVQGNGKVGIGISNATSRLDIQSGPTRTGTHANDRPFYVTGALQESSSGIEFRHDNGTQGIGFGFNTIYATGSNANQDLGLASRGTGILKFSTNGSERLRITGTGNVGIGTATPNAALQFGNVVANRRVVLWESQNNDHEFLGFGINGSTLRYQVSNTVDAHVFYAGTSTTTSQELMRIKGDGNVTITGIIENEGYAAPTLLNGFTNYGNGYVSSGYYKDKEGIVRLRGTVYLNAFPNGFVVFELPAGYRPTSGTVVFSVGNNGGIGLMEVSWDGSVVVQNCVDGWISLDSIVFRAD